MKSDLEIKNIEKNIIKLEADSINNLTNYIDENIVDCVKEILLCTGRVIISGVGKSANISQKIVATFNSTGQPAIFMHASDALHGDLGNIQKNDIIIIISKSGESKEIKSLLPFIKNMNNTIICITGNINSYLAKNSDFVLNVSVKKEACYNNLAPTSSTTSQLVMGDVLAVCLSECRGFKHKDFAKLHPGGSLGKKLTLRAIDLCYDDKLPQVNINDDVKAIILEISKNRLGATVVKNDDKVVGIITDGDLRRMLEGSKDIKKIKAKDIMCKSPKKIDSDCLAIEALKIMEQNSISQIIVMSKNKYVGLIHFHDILNQGLIN